MIHLARLALDDAPGDASGAFDIVVTERSDGTADPRRSRRDRVAWQHTVVGAECSMVAEVHGSDVFDVRGGEPDFHDVAADGLITDAAGPPIAVWAGDCAMVMLVAGTTLVGAHAGWRGLASGMIDVAVDAVVGSALRSHEPAAPGPAVAVPVRAVVGPVIHPCCYEFGLADASQVADGVGVDVADIVHYRNGSTYLDQPTAIAAALTRRGVDVVTVGGCTGCDERWFSYRTRRDVGRHAMVARYVAS